MPPEQMVTRTQNSMNRHSVVKGGKNMNPLYIAIISVTLLCGCASTSPSYNKTFTPHVDPVHGRVVRINRSDRYVILTCTVLPFEGEQITLYRDKRPVARVRATRNRDRHFMVADLLEGAPLPGDWFRGTTKGQIPQQRQ